MPINEVDTNVRLKNGDGETPQPPRLHSIESNHEMTASVLMIDGVYIKIQL